MSGTGASATAISGTDVSSLFDVGSATAGATPTAATIGFAAKEADGTTDNPLITDTGSSGTDFSAIQTANTTTTTSAALTGPTSQLGSVSVNLTSGGAVAGATDTTAFTSINIYGNGSGGYTFKAVDSSGNESTDATLNSSLSGLFNIGTSATAPAGKSLTASPALAAATNPNATNAKAGLDQATALASPPKVSDIDLTAANGANLAIESIDNALNAVNSIQADLGAAQNRFTSIASTQTAQSTNLSSAQSQITDANFAQETANLSKAQVLQQAGISVLAQANSMPQQVLKLLG
ncbi:flagellin [Caballeronia sp. Lep1P3]|uniref:flagellin n=1 Tax=Caballeronia sp. Lep1P3 TaxID=2878150 RepID=UPI00351CBB26